MSTLSLSGIVVRMTADTQAMTASIRCALAAATVGSVCAVTYAPGTMEIPATVIGHHNGEIAVRDTRAFVTRWQYDAHASAWHLVDTERRGSLRVIVPQQ